MKILHFFAACFAGVVVVSTSLGADSESGNRGAVKAAFDDWRAGKGSPFSLLAPDVTWTITGHSRVAKSYHSRDEFFREVIEPFNARLSRPLIPTTYRLFAEGDTVIILFDAEGIALDGLPYRNTYAWFFTFRGGEIVDVVAFFDSRHFDEFWVRVRPLSGEKKSD